MVALHGFITVVGWMGSHQHLRQSLKFINVYSYLTVQSEKWNECRNGQTL